jgi:hypothetical protein
LLLAPCKTAIALRTVFQFPFQPFALDFSG